MVWILSTAREGWRFWQVRLYPSAITAFCGARVGNSGRDGKPVMRDWKNAIANAALCMASIALTFLALEVATRFWYAPDKLFDWSNRIEAHRRHDVGTDIYDPITGFGGSPAFTSTVPEPAQRTVRAMPAPPAGTVAEPPILTTGDSFTFGWEVSDADTWPAFLQGDLRWRTINGGVMGYGLDQIILRTELLVRQERPAATVVGFIADDILRGEMSRVWDVEKPYFELQGDQLVVRNSPPPAGDAANRLTFVQRLLGWSYVYDKIVTRLGGVETEPVGRRVRALPSGAGEKLACPLMRRLAALDTPILVVALYEPRVWTGPPREGAERRRVTAVVLACARAAGLPTLDLYSALDANVRAHGIDSVFGHATDHLDASGNRLAAQAIAIALRPLLPTTASH